MDNRGIKTAFDAISVSDEHMKRRVMEGIKDKRKTRRVPAGRAALVTCAAVLVVGIFAYSTPSVVAFAQDVLKSWGITVSTDNGTVKQEGVYVNLNDTSKSRTEAKYDSMDEIEKLIGVDILESPEAYTGTAGLFLYDPGVKEGKLFSATIMDDMYAIGDLKNVRVKNDVKDVSAGIESRYERGEKYNSPIKCEITVRGVRSDGVGATEYESDEFDLPDGIESIMYTLQKINAKAVIFTLMADDSPGFDSDGPGEVLGEEPITIAKFVYENVSYLYMGRVSIETMEIFLDTLEPERDVN
jgi:hypothetical protein